MSIDKVALGKKFLDARQKLGLSQQATADKAGLHVSHYAKVERGERMGGYDTLEKISKALNLKYPDILKQ
jgi:transcriptional regulator with XRE-family HTH domain